MHESETWKWSHSVVLDSLRPHGLQPTRLLRPWDFPEKSTGVGCHCLLQKKKKNSDTCSLFPPFGDTWPSFLLASQHAFLSSIHPFLGSSILKNEDFPDGAVVKNPPAMQETQRYRFSFWVRKIPWVGNGSTIQYSCLGNPTDRGAWWATDHQVTKNWTRLSKKAAFRR